LRGQCKAVGCKKLAATGQTYCSKECAPLGRFGLSSGSNTRSARMEESLSKAHGEPSRKPALGELMRLQDGGGDTRTTKNLDVNNLNTQKIETKERAPIEESGGRVSPTWSESYETPGVLIKPEEIRKEMKNNESGTEASEKSDSLKSAQAEIVEYHPASSTAPLLNSEEVKLASMSLVDDAIERLHWQMKRLTLRGADQIDDTALYTKTEVRRAKMVCDAAKSLSSLVKLKLDAVKIFRELEKTKEKV
jgi:hypothetical protein